MRRKIILSVLFLVLLIMLIPVIVNGLMNLDLGANGNIEVWITFFGSYIGAIIGGIITGVVAFSIAKYQINHQNYVDRTLEYVKQLPSLIGIRLELRKIVRNFEYTDFNLNNHLASRQVGSINIEQEEIDKDNWRNVNKILDTNLQVEILELQDFYNSLKKVLDFDESQVNIELNSIEIQLTLIGTENIEYAELTKRHSFLMKQLNDISRKKVIMIRRFKEEDYLSKTKELLEIVTTQIEEIKLKGV